MKRFLMIFSACTALFLLTGPAMSYAQHDDPDMEWEDADDMAENEEGEDISSKPLFERWGGKTAIKGVVSEFTARVMADEKLNSHFADKMQMWRMQLVGQLMDASGGPKYMGKPLKKMHMDMGLQDEDMEALTKHLSMSLDWFEFDQSEKDQLMMKLKLKESGSM
jgi:truncated hemoglobin YjbI